VYESMAQSDINKLMITNNKVMNVHECLGSAQVNKLPQVSTMVHVVLI